MSLADDLTAAETEGWQALTTASGADYYESHLTADAMMGFAFGVMDRAEAIAAMRSADPWASFEIREPRVVGLTPDSGVLVYRVEARRAGQTPYSAVVSSVYVREGGRWLLAFHQQTPLQP